MRKLKLKRFWLVPMGIIGIIGVLVISLVVLFSHTPDTSVPFPYVPPPEGPEGYYLEATTDQLTSALTRDYYALDPVRYKGESFIFKNVVIKERRLVDTYLIVGLIQFQTQDPSDLKEFKEGYVVDIIGVCGGALEEGSPVIVFRNCQLLPAGVAPLPLPGGPAIVVGY